MSAQYDVPASYADPEIAIAAIPADLAGQGLQDIVIDKGSYSAFGNITKSNADASNFVRVRAKSGDEHLGIPGAGVLITVPGNTATEFTEFIDLEFKRAGAVVQLHTNSANSKLIRCLFIATADPGTNRGIVRTAITTNSNDVEFYDCMWLNDVSPLSSGGFYANRSEGTTPIGFIFRNCSSYGFGRFDFGRASSFYINVVVDEAGEGTGSALPPSTKTTCATSDASGTAGLINLSTAEIGWTDPAGGDHHIDEGSVLNGAGTDQSAFFTKDIDLETIDTLDWPVGIDYRVPPVVDGDESLSLALSLDIYG